MLARPEVLVACRGFRDAEDDTDSDDDLPFEDDEDAQAAALRVVQLHFGAGDHWVGQSPL